MVWWSRIISADCPNAVDPAARLEAQVEALRSMAQMRAQELADPHQAGIIHDSPSRRRVGEAAVSQRRSRDARNCPECTGHLVDSPNSSSARSVIAPRFPPLERCAALLGCHGLSLLRRPTPRR